MLICHITICLTITSTKLPPCFHQWFSGRPSIILLPPLLLLWQSVNMSLLPHCYHAHLSPIQRMVWPPRDPLHHNNQHINHSHNPDPSLPNPTVPKARDPLQGFLRVTVAPFQCLGAIRAPGCLAFFFFRLFFSFPFFFFNLAGFGPLPAPAITASPLATFNIRLHKLLLLYSAFTSLTPLLLLLFLRLFYPPLSFPTFFLISINFKVRSPQTPPPLLIQLLYTYSFSPFRLCVLLLSFPLYTFINSRIVCNISYSFTPSFVLLFSYSYFSASPPHLLLVPSYFN